MAYLTMEQRLTLALEHEMGIRLDHAEVKEAARLLVLLRAVKESKDRTLGPWRDIGTQVLTFLEGKQS